MSISLPPNDMLCRICGKRQEFLLGDGAGLYVCNDCFEKVDAVANSRSGNVMVAVKWFAQQDWTIEIGTDSVVAVMSSGYGSGPAIVDILDLCKAIENDGY